MLSDQVLLPPLQPPGLAVVQLMVPPGQLTHLLELPAS